MTTFRHSYNLQLATFTIRNGYISLQLQFAILLFTILQLVTLQFVNLHSANLQFASYNSTQIQLATVTFCLS